MFKLVNGFVVDEDGMKIHCHICGRYLTESDVKEMDGEEVILYEDSNGGFFCSGCKDGLRECPDCGEIYHRTDMYYIDFIDRYVCESCLENNYSRCECCGEYFPNDEVHYTRVYGSLGNYNIDLCDNCLDENYRYCNDCGVYVHEDDACYDSYDDEYYCPDCFGGSRDTSSINDYHFDSHPTYHMPYLGEELRHSNLMKGIELEVEKEGGWRRGANPGEDADTVHNIIGEKYNVICHDGSLDDGFEIISCPATTKHHLETLKWKDALQWLSDNGYISHKSGNCGLHVHLDREYFRGISKEDVEGRFFIILRNNLQWLKLFSRRYRYSYCKINGYDNNFDGEGDSINKISYPPDKVWLGSKKQTERHMALNFYPEHTIEIRLFRGTLRYKSFVATLQLCDIWAEIVRKYDNRQCLDVNLDNFLDTARRLGYTEFLEYLKERHIIDDNSQEF